jgi:uncharacterized SAM-binding protein YcdF (DUF218 family)
MSTRRSGRPRAASIRELAAAALLSITVILICPLDSKAVDRLLSLLAQFGGLPAPPSLVVFFAQVLVLAAPIVVLAALLAPQRRRVTAIAGAVLVAVSSLGSSGPALLGQTGVVLVALVLGHFLHRAGSRMSPRVRAAARAAATRLTAGLLVLCTLWAGATLAIVTAASDGALPDRIDAVMVLGPSEPRNVSEGLRLASRSRGAVLVISSSKDGDGRFKNKECAEPLGFRVVCLEAEPATTEGEMTAFEELASSSQWTSVALVTSVPHVPRARWIADRCLSADHVLAGRSEPVGVSAWMVAGAYQSAAWVKALLHPPCT